MSIFVSFTAGAALFYLHRYFPCTSFSLAFILLLMFALSGFRNYRSTRQKKPLSFFAAGIVAVLIMLPLVITGLHHHTLPLRILSGFQVN
jgi:hypothetical protein